MYKSRKAGKPKQPASGFILINHNLSQEAELTVSEYMVMKSRTPQLRNSIFYRKAVIIIAVYQAKHCTTPIRLPPIPGDLSLSIPNLQCHGALWILSTLYKISVQRKYSSTYLVTKMNIWCPALLNYLGLLCKFQTLASTAKIWVT